MQLYMDHHLYKLTSNDLNLLDKNLLWKKSLLVKLSSNIRASKNHECFLPPIDPSTTTCRYQHNVNLIHSGKGQCKRFYLFILFLYIYIYIFFFFIIRDNLKDESFNRTEANRKKTQKYPQKRKKKTKTKKKKNKSLYQGLGL